MFTSPHANATHPALTSRPHSDSRFPVAAALALCTVAALLAGCGAGVGSSVGGGSSAGGGGGTAVQTPVTTSSATISGMVHGGQQPVVGAQIALYAAGKTAIASAARSMLTQPVVSGVDGSFTLTGLYSCQAGDQVYVVAHGGSAGAGPNNDVTLMTALGPCGTLLANAATTFIHVDELTTVASVYALASFMTGPANLGSDAPAGNALAAAFANTRTLVDPSTGLSLVTSTGNGIVPQTTINSLANSLAACINSAPAASNTCSSLFADTTVAGSTPVDTLGAALNLAHAPATNTSAVFLLGGGNPPYQPTLTAAPASYAITVAHPSDVLTYHDNIARTGVQNYETALTPATINAAHFGKLYSLAVDSYLFAQPLYVGGIGMPDGAVHNLLIAATTHGTVYAFDADGSNPSGGSLWSKSLVPSGERYPVGADYGNCPNPPEAGIVGTPVIDRTSQTLYVVVKTIAGSTFTQRLHAISLIDGTERTGSPQAIAPTFSGSGAGSAAGTVAFNAQRQLDRSSLLLAPNAAGGNTVWISFASHCDIGPYHGIVLGYDGASLAMNAAFINTPNGSDGGIWMSNGGLAADSAGYIYALSGNGTFDANLNGADYGDTALKLAPPAAGASSPLMTVADYFTPSNQADLSESDLDLGGAEGILLNDPASGVAPHLLIASDKHGSVYLINTAAMTRYDTGPANTNGDLQDFTAGGTFIYNFSFFNNTLYTSTPLSAFAFTPGTSTTAGSFNLTPVAQPGINQTAPVVSANGTANGIVWAQDTSGVLHAYTAASLTELYNTTQATGGRDSAAPFVKFTSPIIANGKVFLSGQGAVTVYGPL